MLMTVVILFALSVGCPCTSVSQLIYFFDEETELSLRSSIGSRFLEFLGHANSAVNPTVYARFNSNFRNGFRDIWLCRCRCCRNRVAPQTNVGSGIGRDGANGGVALTACARKRPRIYTIAKGEKKLYTECCSSYNTSHNIIRLTPCKISSLKSLTGVIFPAKNN